MHGPYPTDLKFPGRGASPDLVSLHKVLDLTGAGRRVDRSSFHDAAVNDHKTQCEDTHYHDPKD
jgi:hypothetical protein